MKPFFKRFGTVALAVVVVAGSFGVGIYIGSQRSLAIVDTTPTTLYGTDGKENLPHEWDDETAAAMSPRLESGATPHDKNRALDMAFKHLGLYERDNAQRGESLAIQVNIVK